MHPDNPESALFKFPTAFAERMKNQLPDQWDDFSAAHESTSPVSVLLNTAKLGALPFPNMTGVPWCPNGYYLDERPIFTLDPLLHAGAYYVMEPSSMFLSHILKTTLPDTDGLRILDLCAAPGGKSMVTASLLSDADLLISNEIHPARYSILRENLVKWGSPRVWTLKADPSRIDASSFFDCVIVDAPCSGEGLFRKDPAAMDSWSLENVYHCSLRQRRILHEAQRLLKPGGLLIYSTCTYASDENIEHIAWLTGEGLFSSVEIPGIDNVNIETIHRGKAIGYQCFPHRVRGEGFFIAALRNNDEPASGTGRDAFQQKLQNRKQRSSIPEVLQEYISTDSEVRLIQNSKNEWFAVPTSMESDMRYLGSVVPRIEAGVKLGVFKGHDFVPSHDLALSPYLSPDIPSIDLDSTQAIHYLRKEHLGEIQTVNGWYLVKYEGLSLGWAKQTQGGLKNYYPMNYRIRM